MFAMPKDEFPPLDGIRVLEAARILAGPYCGQLLGDLGAEVIKIERPGRGDDTREWGPPFHGALSAYFMSCNRNKRSITLDMQHPEGSRILQSLLQQSDVLIENFRSDSLRNLGLTAEELLKLHPKLIVCSISGFGRTGPDADAPGYDFAIQALSGLMNITGPVDGPPFKVGVALVDILTGLYASTAILACLHARKSSGHGYAIDLSLQDCALASQVNVAQAYLTSGVVPPRLGNGHLQIVPYNMFPTRDGYLVLNVGNDSQWNDFCAVSNVPHLAAKYPTNRSRVEHREEVDRAVADVLRGHTTEEWVTRLSKAKIPHATVRDYAQIFNDPQILARNMKISVHDVDGQQVELIGSPFQINASGERHYKAPPPLGADTYDILKSLLNMDSGTIESLRNQGVL